MPDERFGFEADVRPGGYRWWYLDGVSDDGAHAITVIAFIGSVFSPYYAWSGRRDPFNHVAVNVALYGANGRWAMSERGRRALHRTPDSLAVGPSRLELTGEGLDVWIDERCAPIPRRLKGRVTVRPDALSESVHQIDGGGAHHWCPLAGSTPIEVAMTEPALSWRGTGYLDMNFGEVPLERTFAHWDWMRVDLGGGRSAIVYETEEHDGDGRRLALLTANDGSVEPLASPPRVPLPRTMWGVTRTGWGEGADAALTRTLEDTPFYVRSELVTTMLGARRVAIHETLSLRRFARTYVKLMLPFRMPRLS